MAKTNFLKDLVDEITNELPAHFGALKKDFEESCRTILNRAFDKFDIVTREEFDIQVKVLARSRKQLDELKAEIKALEKLIKKKHAKRKD